MLALRETAPLKPRDESFMRAEGVILTIATVNSPRSQHASVWMPLHSDQAEEAAFPFHFSIVISSIV